ncbi:MAG: hypothetical protein AAF799_38960 [Myxococcota bacterium]
MALGLVSVKRPAHPSIANEVPRSGDWRPQETANDRSQVFVWWQREGVIERIELGRVFFEMQLAFSASPRECERRARSFNMSSDVFGFAK